MGQLEKYGLYVLVVVIVLILGVAIWGDERRPEDESLAVNGAYGANAATHGLDRQERGGDRSGATDRDPFYDTVNPPIDTNSLAHLATPVDVEPEADPSTRRDDGPGRSAEPRAAAFPRVYEVQSGDNPTKIVKRFGGRDADVPIFMAANPGLEPTKMNAGDTVLVPDFAATTTAATTTAASTTAATPSAVTPTQYVVQPDDYPQLISQKVYGTMGHWRKILQHNGLREEDAKRLRKGQVLSIPPLASIRD